jgi:hypothetical protein
MCKVRAIRIEAMNQQRAGSIGLRPQILIETEFTFAGTDRQQSTKGMP